MDGKKLRKWREKRGLTQLGAAEALFSCLAQYQNWEYGKYPVPDIISAFIALQSEVAKVPGEQKEHPLLMPAMKLYKSIWQRVPVDPKKYCKIKAEHIHALRDALMAL